METNEKKQSDIIQSIWVSGKRSVAYTSFHESFLLVLWGWILFLDYFRFYICKKVMVSYEIRMMLVYISTTVVILGALYTLFYLSKRVEKHKTQPGASLIFTWISAFLFMGMIIVIQKNTMGQVVFELQHSLFMIVTGSAIVITGRLIKDKPVLWGGFLFVVLGFVASYLKLADQLLLECIAWAFAFIIPGHILFKSASKASKILKSRE